MLGQGKRCYLTLFCFLQVYVLVLVYPALLTPEELHILIYLKFDLNKTLRWCCLLPTVKKSVTSILYMHLTQNWPQSKSLCLSMYAYSLTLWKPALLDEKYSVMCSDEEDNHREKSSCTLCKAILVICPRFPPSTLAWETGWALPAGRVWSHFVGSVKTLPGLPCCTAPWLLLTFGDKLCFTPCCAHCQRWYKNVENLHCI